MTESVDQTFIQSLIQILPEFNNLGNCVRSGTTGLLSHKLWVVIIPSRLVSNATCDIYKSKAKLPKWQLPD